MIDPATMDEIERTALDREELAMLRADVEAARRDLPISLDEAKPGSTVAKLLMANRILKQRVGALEARVREQERGILRLEEELGEARTTAVRALEEVPAAVPPATIGTHVDAIIALVRAETHR